MQKIVHLWQIVLVVLLMSGYSCKNDNKVDPYFIIETTDGNDVPDILTVGSQELTQSYIVKSNGSWKIVPSGGNTSWVSVYPDFGEQNGSFSLRIGANNTFLQRKAKLSCTINGQELFELSIEQSAFQASLSVTPVSPADLPASGGEIELTVETNTDWDYHISDNTGWITEKSKNATGITLGASANMTANSRAVIVTFNIPSMQGIQQQVRISQEGADLPPLADILDVAFKIDGTAVDISPLNQNVLTVEGSSLTTLFSNTYDRYLARFSHFPGSAISSGYYKVDYSANQTVKDALADGHTLEAMFMFDADTPPNAEIKMFSSHEGGGTGLMIGNNSRNNSIIFLPHIGSGYVWNNSGIIPERGRYYHVVGVWNKVAGRSYIYVDGVLKDSQSTSGNYNPPSAGSNWFGIGCDAGPNPQAGWKGDVVIARIYDQAFAAKDVEKLWQQVENLIPDPDEIKISDISLPSKRVLLNSTYSVKGIGFAAGDRIRMIPVSGTGNEYLCDGAATENSINITIPAGFVTGKYRFFVVRGSKTLDLGFATLTVVDDLFGATQIIAHRGYWVTGETENSIGALKEAQKLGIYGSEFDVWITTDGKVVLNHDATLKNGVRIETSTYAQIENFTLANGEKLPTLEQFLEQGKKDPSTKLILEIKTHSNSTNNDRVTTAAVNIVQAAGMANQVEYIAFSIDVCKKVLELQPNAIVAYLNGDYTPQALHNLGIKGIDYPIATIRANKNWIAEAQNLGMTVNVWTVNSENDLRDMIDLEVDFITTDQPVLAKQLTEE